MEINLKQLEAFVTTVDHASFTRAAEKLGLTQSTVSAHISGLEDNLRVRLIHRGSRRRVQLTEAGNQAYALAKEILKRCNTLQNLGTSFQKNRLKVGASSVPAQYLIPEIMSGFLCDYPDIRYVLTREDSVKIHQLLGTEEIRIGFVGAALDREHFHYQALAGDRLVLIAANNEFYRRQKEKAVSGRELLTQPMLLREETSGTRRAFEAYLHRCNISLRSLNLIAQIDNTETIKSSVSRDIGVSVVSELTVQEEIASGKLLSFDLDAGGVFRNIYMVWRKDIILSDTEQQFINYVQLWSKEM